jgi:hypothetical protein
LARATLTHSGYLDSETSLLRNHLDAVSQRILDGYPDDVEDDELGNWQLLATVDALLGNDATCANYHFAWFHTR